MDFQVKMPRLGEEMKKGSVVEWLKKEGDIVSEKDILFVVDTEKATLEVEAGVKGTLKKILVETGVETPVGQPIAIVEN
jgi:pyruvate/2-oxoglutarate dehydrogenase complex dihydrolipoamide acyltransferase (E2) component